MLCTGTSARDGWQDSWEGHTQEIEQDRRGAMKQFISYREQALQKWDSQIVHSAVPVIYLGTASSGIAAGALDILEVIRQTVAELGQTVRIVQVGCIGPCYLEPIMDIAMPGQARVSYTNVSVQKAKKILKS